MDFTEKQLEEITRKLFNQKCPICGSIDKFVQKGPAEFVYFKESDESEKSPDYNALVCMLAICQCSYVMMFNLTPFEK